MLFLFKTRQRQKKKRKIKDYKQINKNGYGIQPSCFQNLFIN